MAGLAGLVLVASNGGPFIAAVAVMAAASGVITSTSMNGLIFTGVAAGIAAVALSLPAAAALSAAGPAAFAVAAAVQGTFPGRLLEVAAVCLAGLVSGGARRQFTQRARQAALVAAASQRAELAAERNRLGRELHDVLAHTLGALSIQLTALDTVARTSSGREELLAQIERSRQLVGDGLDEARLAVRALRGDDTPLPTQLQRLCGLHGAALQTVGTSRPLGAEASLVLYRVAQEALTNAARHAPGAAVSVQFFFASAEVALTVRNSLPAPLAHTNPHTTGGGYGLPGMHERVQQADGHLQYGPTDDGGWQVTARMPA
jgi:signal transduction histidine kinase